MMIYRRSTESSSKWIVAFILFIAVMTFTVDQVFGMPGPSRRSSGRHHSGEGHSSNHGNTYDSYHRYSFGDCQTNPEPTPNAVPEPTTLVLMGIGLAAAGAIRKKLN